MQGIGERRLILGREFFLSMLKSFYMCVRDRKWMLLIWLVFWAMLLVTNRALLQSAGLIVFWALICVCSFAYVLLFEGMTARDFLMLAALLGLFFIFIVPFPSFVDENYHFARAFALSGGKPFPYWQDGALGVALPAGFESYAGPPAEWNLINFWQNKELWLAPADELVFVTRNLSASYLPLDYVFSVAGIGIGRLLKLPLLFLVLLGRLFNYAACVAAAYMAVRKAKYYRSLFFMVAVLPCCLCAAATIHIDAPLIAFSLLYVSIALNYCLDDAAARISKTDVALLLVSAAFILSTKFFGYCLLLPLIFFARKRKLQNFRAVLFMLGGVTLLIAAWQLWALMAFPGSLDSAEVKEGVSASGQIAWALANKGSFFTIISRDFLQNLFTRLYAYSFVEEPAFSFISLPLRFVPFIAAARAKDKYPLALKQRRAFNAYWLLAAAIMMLACNLSLYFTWTPVGADFIDGVQMRYTLPYMIFILLALSTLSPVNNMKNWERRIGFLMGLSLLNMVTGTLVQYL